MRRCNISSIDAARSVQEVILSWGPNSSFLRRALIAAVLVSTAGTAAANVLVVRSSGPSAASYRPGQSLPNNARITLRAGDQVMILANGGTRTFRGPGTFSPNTRVASNATVNNGGRIARVGAVRNAGIIPRGPTIWHVDVTQSGTFCLAGASNVMLWRPDASAPVRFTVTGPAGTRTLNWRANQPTAPWPRQMAITNGATYTFTEPGVAVPVTITFRLLSSEPHDVQGVAQALIANGCQGQLDVLVESQPQQTAAN
jgi:hypothetical protein